MHQRACLVVALATTLVLAALAGPAMAATSDGTDAQSSFPGPGAGAQAKKLAYGRYCGSEGRHHNARKAKERRGCISAMAHLAAGKPSSPSAACRPLKRKRSKGRKASKAAYKHCVKVGKQLQKSQQAAEDEEAAAQDEADEADEAAEAAEAADELAQQLAENAAGNGPADLPALGPLPPDMPGLDAPPAVEPDEDPDWGV